MTKVIHLCYLTLVKKKEINPTENVVLSKDLYTRFNEILKSVFEEISLLCAYQ